MFSSSSPSPPVTPQTSDSECDSDCNRSTSLDHLSINPIESRPSPHPFAASTKADRSPPAYEKKLLTPPTTPPDLKRQTPTLNPREFEERKPQKTSIQRTLSMAQTEQHKWDTAISSVVDKAETKLDLSSANLTYIPPSIIDLKNLVLLESNRTFNVAPNPRVFSRSTTAPALLPSPHFASNRPFLPSRTTNELAFGGAKRYGQPQGQTCSRCEVELYLMRNAIRTLPRELFALDCLVVLSLRQNKLTSIPPAIGQLTRLRELNIGGNRIVHLPAEILRLHLTSLHLHPNPFIPPPPRESKLTRHLGPLTCSSFVPTLSELVLRYLLAPKMPGTTTTRLEAVMTKAEIDTLPLPTHIQRVVRSSTGHFWASEGGMDAVEDLSMTICPSPGQRHRGTKVRFLEDVGPGEDYDTPVFATPVEVRMEWVGIVAGVHVAENPTAWIPVLWRGCSKGCLAFLEENEEGKVELLDEPVFEAGIGEEGEEFEFSDEE